MKPATEKQLRAIKVLRSLAKQACIEGHVKDDKFREFLMDKKVLNMGQAGLIISALKPIVDEFTKKKKAERKNKN